MQPLQQPWQQSWQWYLHDGGECLTHADMPDFFRVQLMNEGLSRGHQLDFIVDYGKPYTITIMRSDNRSAIFHVEDTRTDVVLNAEQDPSDRSGYMLGSAGLRPKYSQLF